MRCLYYWILCLISFLGIAEVSFAGRGRETQVEWEPIQDAVSYDVEFINTKNQTMALKLNEARESKLKVSLEPGSYQVRVRSRDDRGLSGRWGDPQIIMIPEFPIVIKSPSEGEAIQAENNMGLVTLKWDFAKVDGSFPINIQIYKIQDGVAGSSKDRPLQSLSASGHSVTVDLPVGSFYEARFFSKNSDQSDVARVRFQVVGPPLEAPQIKQTLVGSQSVLSFYKPEGAETITVQIQGLDTKDGQFKILTQRTLNDQLNLPLEELPVIRPLIIQAHSESSVRAASTQQTFLLDKDPPPERNAIDPSDAVGTSQKVFRRTASASLFARYNLSSAQYRSQSFENSSVSTSSGITGTLAVGGGKFFSSGAHGLFSQFEFGGITVENSNYTFTRAQVNYVFRKSLLLALELRGGLGLRYATLPEVNKLSDDSIRSGAAWSAGPNFHLDLWYQVSSRFAARAELNASVPFVGETASKAQVQSGLAYHYSLKVAYRWNPRIIVSLGALVSDELLQSPGSNPVGDLTGENQLQLSSLGAIASLEWRLP